MAVVHLRGRGINFEVACGKLNMIRDHQSDIGAAAPTHVPAWAAFRFVEQRRLPGEEQSIDGGQTARGRMPAKLWSVFPSPAILQGLRLDRIRSFAGSQKRHANIEHSAVRLCLGNIRKGLRGDRGNAQCQEQRSGQDFGGFHGDISYLQQ